MFPDLERMLSMANITEIEIKGSNMDEIKAENRVRLTRVTFSNGEHITVSGNDISIIERFKKAGDDLEALADRTEEKDSKELSLDEKIALRKEFSEEAEKIMDAALGGGTTRKYFGDVYEDIPEFKPDVECFFDFWDSLIPVIERLSEHKIKLEKLASKKRMAKYQPQDHKKAQKKGTK